MTKPYTLENLPEIDEVVWIKAIEGEKRAPNNCLGIVVSYFQILSEEYPCIKVCTFEIDSLNIDVCYIKTEGFLYRLSELEALSTKIRVEFITVAKES